MSRVSISPATQQARTIESSRKRIAQGERPGFNVLVRTSISGLMWAVLGSPEVTGSAMARPDVEPRLGQAWQRSTRSRATHSTCVSTSTCGEMTERLAAGLSTIYMGERATKPSLASPHDRYAASGDSV